MPFLDVSGISRKEQTGFSLKDISFTLEKGKKLAIAGETGSGKSTLLKVIAGLTQQDEGLVRFEGEKVWGPGFKLVPGHKGISYLSQYFELRNNYRVADLLAIDNQLSEEASAELYRICQIDHFLGRKTDQLSGGEKHRIALARALSFSPKLLLLDEPYSNLDVTHKNVLKSVLREVGERLNITCVLISHDPEDSLSWADEIMVMRDGAIVQRGTPREVYRKPVSEYVAGLFGKYNLIPAARLSKVDNGKNALIRPGHFKVSRPQWDKPTGIPATIETVTFLGDIQEIEAALQTGGAPVRVLVRTSGVENFVAGDKVQLSVTTADIWYI